MLHLRLSPTDPLWDEVACTRLSNFEGLDIPDCLFISSEDIESHASLSEIDWLVDLLADQNILYFGAGVGLWAVHLAARAKSVFIDDESSLLTSNALHIAEANKREIRTELGEAGEVQSPTTAIINLRREPDVAKALAHNPERIVVFGALSFETTLGLFDAGFKHMPEYTEAAVFELSVNKPN